MKQKENRLQHEIDYLAFLKKRLESQHFQQNATPEELVKTKQKYDKAKLLVRMLQVK